ncbi:MAG TPA: protein kinase [Nannocystaceae bacterium]|nr:protein kinase [Nannocystaceae bacterium]
MATPRIDDMEARRARASVASKLFGGPKQPVRVGRYQVLGRIGSGGMGVVYRAHDPELARDVAVKFMNSEAANAEVATARARLVREARAMARLAHPNVIHVYDVGTVDDGVFIAMELVEGESLATWLAREARDWLDVLRRYVDAGRGLAAAHAAGVVHRDFKPENVLVGIDGRVRVGDFGLAGAPAIAGAPSLDDMRSSDAGELDESSMSGGALTRTGALLGTPKYMAPEQEHGALASARSDQFSFCVALYEGLYGRPPFEGDTIARYRRNVRHGRVIAPPIDTKVKSWVHAEIVRGMSIDPAERHPGMEVLLDKLERALADPRIARSWFRRVAVVAPLVAIALGIGAWVGAQRNDEAPAIATLDSDDGNSDTPVPDSSLREVPPIEPTTPATSPPVPAPTKVEAVAPAKADVESTRPRKPDVQSPRVAGKGVVCYWHEDMKTKLFTRKKAVRAPQSAGDTCYVCARPVPESAEGALEPKAGCSKHYYCAKVSQETCTDQAAG